VVHVDHGIGQFEGLRLIESAGRRGEFMLLRYLDDARLYVPLERMDLVQSYRAAEGAQPALDKFRRHGVGFAQNACAEVAGRHGGPVADAVRRAQNRAGLCVFAGRQLAKGIRGYVLSLRRHRTR